MTDSKTATEILRELLDARRVEHEDNWCGDVTYTKWQGIGGMWFLAHDCSCNGQLLYIQGRNMTPEQAIAATLGSDEYQRGYDDGLHANTKAAFAAAKQALGSGECEFVVKDNMNETEGMGDVWFECSECGVQFDYETETRMMDANYCPHCGRRVRK